MHQGADELSRLSTDGKKRTDFDDDLPLWNGENTHVTNAERAHMQIFMEWNDEKKPITTKPDKDYIRNREMSDCMVQLAERQSTEDEVPSEEESTDEQRKSAFYHKVTTQVGVSKSKFHVDRSGLSAQT